MRAAFYETQGPAREVLKVGTMADPTPGPDELRIRVAASGINPGDIKKRQDAFGSGMPYPRVIPHSDGAGVVRYPLERIAAQHADARFVRINREYATVPASLANRALGIAGDAGEVVASVWLAFAS